MISADFFDSISEFFITKPSLCGRLVSMYIAERNIWVMGVPVSLTHTKYPRNALLFNLAFVVDGKYENLEAYFSSIEQALMKLSGYLTTLERECEYLFRHGNFEALLPNISTTTTTTSLNTSSGATPSQSGLSMSLPVAIKSSAELENKIPLPHVMVHLFESINAKLAATVNVDRGNTMYLKLYPDRSEPADVLLHQVPVPILSSNFTYEALVGIVSMWSPYRASVPSGNVAESSSLKSSDAQSSLESKLAPSASTRRSDYQEEWDLALRRIIPFIDGVSHVKKICAMAAMELPAVSKALQHLLYYNCIKMIDIFQFSNIYTTQSTLRELYADPMIQKACLETIIADRNKPIDFHAIFALYAQFQPDVTVKSIVLRNNLEELNVDIRALVQFGLLNNLLRRIHKYPVSIAATSSTVTSVIYNVHQMVDGKHSYDEIAVAHDLPYSELDKHFDLWLYH